MGALCCCLGVSDEQGDSVVEESGDFLRLKWFFRNFIKKPTTAQTPEPACRRSGVTGDATVLDLKPRQREETSHSGSTNDEDSCPTCFYEYTEEHPKIIMKCSHHYHLSCIYEWMERSEYCPACRKMMLFDESS